MTGHSKQLLLTIYFTQNWWILYTLTDYPTFPVTYIYIPIYNESVFAVKFNILITKSGNVCVNN